MLFISILQVKELFFSSLLRCGVRKLCGFWLQEWRYAVLNFDDSLSQIWTSLTTLNWIEISITSSPLITHGGNWSQYGVHFSGHTEIFWPSVHSRVLCATKVSPECNFSLANWSTFYYSDKRLSIYASPIQYTSVQREILPFYP